jgi:tetraacyldisaccharide 4'-kinase
MIPGAPAFWGRPSGLFSDLLLPAGIAWDAAGRMRRALTRPYHAPAPVICVGNLTVGGAGKTPVVMALAAWFGRAGRTAHVVTRGYGGRLGGPVRVDSVLHDAAAVGDEALLHAMHAPCWVARDRAAGTAAAAQAGAEMILLDDGFQNPAVAKSAALVVVDAAYGFGNRRVIPAGPLRENLRRGLARADALVLVATAGEPPAEAPGEIAAGRPTIPAMLSPVAAERFVGERVFAFAGIGRPEKFFATLRALGADLVEGRSFPDHHPFTTAEIAALRQAAERQNARLITTEKDFVRIPAPACDGIEVLEVEICWPEPAALRALLAPILAIAENGRDPGRDRR